MDTNFKIFLNWPKIFILFLIWIGLGIINALTGLVPTYPVLYFGFLTVSFVGMLIIWLFESFLVSKGQKLFANIISSFCFLGLISWFIWAAFVEYGLHGTFGTFRQNAFWQIPFFLILAYFVTTLFVINNKN